MTPRPPLPIEPFSAEERDLASRLARLDATAAPSAALDARVLAAARAAAAPARRERRWPTAVGAAAVLVAAVGLAWQLRPMFELPPPAVRHVESAGDAGTQGVQSETVVQIESIRRAPPPVAVTGDRDASTATAAAPRRAPATQGGVPPPQATVTRRKAPARAPDVVDEAVPAADTVPMPAAAVPPRALAAEATQRTSASPQLKAAGSRADVVVPTPDVSADTRLAAPAWLVRIRERRDAGDIEGARASLQRFIAAHPRVLVPSDLRPLLRDDGPWPP